MLKFQELRAKSVQELHELALKLRSEIYDLRFKVRSRELKNVRELRTKRKDLALVLTLLNNEKLLV